MVSSWALSRDIEAFWPTILRSQCSNVFGNDAEAGTEPSGTFYGRHELSEERRREGIFNGDNFWVVGKGTTESLSIFRYKSNFTTSYFIGKKSCQWCSALLKEHLAAAASTEMFLKVKGKILERCVKKTTMCNRCCHWCCRGYFPCCKLSDSYTNRPLPYKGGTGSGEQIGCTFLMGKGDACPRKPENRLRSGWSRHPRPVLGNGLVSIPHCEKSGQAAAFAWARRFTE